MVVEKLDQEIPGEVVEAQDPPVALAFLEVEEGVEEGVEVALLHRRAVEEQEVVLGGHFQLLLMSKEYSYQLARHQTEI